MKNFVVIRPVDKNNEETLRFQKLLNHVLDGQKCRTIKTESQLSRWLSSRQKSKKEKPCPLLFAVFVGSSGINMTLNRMLQVLRSGETDILCGCIGGIIVDGDTDLYTRSVGREILLTANMRGCLFPGKPLVEGTRNLFNFDVIAGNMGVANKQAYFATALDLTARISNFSPPRWQHPSLLVLHASNHDTSNTLAYWRLIREHLHDIDIQEIHIENGSVVDCTGCPYKMCLHYAKQSNCFYGGIMVEEVYPAISSCNALLLLCPNYNDALSANLSAFINRLTALFRKTPFYDKYIYSIVVSGYSGSDIVARQLISALNINKAFVLPPNFVGMETANSAGSILGCTGIEERAAAFATAIMAQTTKE